MSVTSANSRGPGRAGGVLQLSPGWAGGSAVGPEDSGGTRAGGLSSGRVCRPARGRLGGQPSDSQPGHHVPTHPECRQWLHVLLPGHQGLDSESFSFGAVSVLETCRALPFLTPRRALGQLSGTSVDPSLPSGFFLESLQQAFCSSLPGCPVSLPLLDRRKSRIFTLLGGGSYKRVFCLSSKERQDLG